MSIKEDSSQADSLYRCLYSRVQAGEQLVNCGVECRKIAQTSAQFVLNTQRMRTQKIFHSVMSSRLTPTCTKRCWKRSRPAACQF